MLDLLLLGSASSNPTWVSLKAGCRQGFVHCGSSGRISTPFPLRCLEATPMAWLGPLSHRSVFKDPCHQAGHTEITQDNLPTFRWLVTSTCSLSSLLPQNDCFSSSGGLGCGHLSVLLIYLPLDVDLPSQPGAQWV